MSYKQEMGSKEIYSDGTFNKKTVDLINSSALGDPNSKSNNSFSVSGLDLKSSGLNVGDQFNFGNTLGSITDLEDNSTPDYTVPGFSGSKDFKSAFGAARSGGLKEFEFYTVLFSMSRSLGIVSQVVLARAMGLPLTRPKSLTFDALNQL